MITRQFAVTLPCLDRIQSRPLPVSQPLLRLRIETSVICQIPTPTVGGISVGDLANNNVVIEAVPLRQAHREQFQQGTHIQPADQPHSAGSLPGLARA